MATKPSIIALEEHYYDPEVKRHARGLDAIAAPATVQRLDDLGELRLREMDEAGIDLQVLSHIHAGAAEARRGNRGAIGAPRQRPAQRGGARSSRAVRCLRSTADR